MGCDKCESHSSHSTMLELHEKRLDTNNIEHKEIKDSMKFKVSRWIFIISLTFISTALGFQIVILNNVSSKVAVLYDRQISKDEIKKIVYPVKDETVYSKLLVASK